MKVLTRTREKCIKKDEWKFGIIIIATIFWRIFHDMGITCYHKMKTIECQNLIALLYTLSIDFFSFFAHNLFSSKECHRLNHDWSCLVGKGLVDSTWPENDITLCKLTFSSEISSIEGTFWLGRMCSTYKPTPAKDKFKSSSHTLQ